MTKIIIITGNIGAGKSTVSDYLKKKGYTVVDTDKMVHKVYETEETAEKIKENFGEKYLTNGTVDRKKLAELVFRSEESMNKLENLIHPVIMYMLEKFAREFDGDVFFVEMPQFFEIENYVRNTLPIGKVWLVTSAEDIRLKRIMERDGIDREEAIRRLRAQMPERLKREGADELLINDGEVEDLHRQIGEILMGEKI